MKINRFTSPLWDLDTFHLFEDFAGDQLDANWVDTVSDSGTVVTADARSGVIVLSPSDGTATDNDEAYLASANEVFKIADASHVYGRARIKFTEAATDKANVFFGFVDAIGADTLVDNGGGLKASFSGAAIFKTDGSTVWKCITSNGATQTITASATVAGNADFQVLEIEFSDWDGVQMQVVFKHNGEYLKDANGYVIRHRVAVTSATEMQVGVGVKNGTTTAESLSVDYIYAAQNR